MIGFRIYVAIAAFFIESGFFYGGISSVQVLNWPIKDLRCSVKLDRPFDSD